ncbi:MAG: serine protease [Candidatus Omnitrophica bacterium]|nr:serine protease [Patescibacteria group bacterium]MDD5546833.1 serine protease [Candidatus Omnitrophota bacterium]
MKKRISLLCVIYFTSASFCYAGEICSRENIVPCVVLLEQKSNIASISINGVKSELWYKEPGSAEPKPRYEFFQGTGFLVSSENNKLFLVTAAHVALTMTPSAQITFKGENDAPISLALSEASGFKKELPWVYHPEADVAVLPLFPENVILIKYFKNHFLPQSLISSEKVPPSRDIPLTVFGFPLGFGAVDTFSPLTKTSHTASSLMQLSRFDNGKVTTFYILEDPSITGYSGGPVFDVSMYKIGALSTTGSGTKLVGIMHGTLSDPTGGKLAAVVPSYFIVETINLALSEPSNK